jgi:hypothetical protein
MLVYRRVYQYRVGDTIRYPPGGVGKAAEVDTMAGQSLALDTGPTISKCTSPTRHRSPESPYIQAPA